MAWIKVRRSPFGRDEDPLARMISLLSAKDARCGVPLSEDEKDILRAETNRREEISPLLEEKIRPLIQNLLVTQAPESIEDPKSFGNSLEWAGDFGYPTIVALTEAVVVRSRKDISPRAIVYDRLRLVACGIGVVLLMMFLVVTASLLLKPK